MKSHTKNLRFNHNPLNLILGTRKKQGLRIGYMEAALDGFYLNCMETGVHPEKLSKLLSDKFHCTDAISSCQLFLFLINEGDRASYSIMVPYLLSTENLNQFENTIRERFYGVDRFIQQGRNLYKFKEYIEERGEPIVWINDLERGVRLHHQRTSMGIHRTGEHVMLRNPPHTGRNRQKFPHRRSDEIE